MFSTGAVAQLAVQERDGLYTSPIKLFAPEPVRTLASSNDAGQVVDLGTFPAAVELVFGITVQETSKTFKMGPGNRNPDLVPHAFVECLGDGNANVGFEDLINGDNDYNDVLFQVRQGPSSGEGLADVTITLTGGGGFTPRATTTASDGTYSFSNVPVPNNYRITPSNPSYAFRPSQLFLSDVMSNQTNKNFVAKLLNTYKISGSVKLGIFRLAGVTMTLTSPTPAGFTPRTTTTDSDGRYAFTGVPAGRDYTVMPQRTGYQFKPEGKSPTDLSADQVLHFQVKVYSITGRITRANTTRGIGGVTVMSPTLAEMPARSKQTDSAGYYTIWMRLLAEHDYRIKPTKSGFTFSPQTKQITNLSNNIPAGAATNFTGTGP